MAFPTGKCQPEFHGLSRLGLDSFRRSKMVVMDHKPVVQDWWHPYPDDWFFDDVGRSHVD